MNTISYSAPAKIHLMGEHSVVHGRPAVLAAIDKHVTVTLQESKNNEGFIFENNDKSLSDFRHIIETSIKTYFKDISIPSYSATITSTIPIGTGLGSSAALSAISTATLLEFLEIPFDNALVFKIAYEGEKFFHGNPSGGDLAVVIEGGLLYFRKEFEFLKSFSKLDFNISNSVNNFYIINSGRPEESTLTMVKHVGELKEKNTEKIEKIFWNQEKITKDLVTALKDGNEDLIIKCIRQGEKNLETLEVVGEKAKTIISDIESIGGAAKISGGGGVKNGSGMLLTYCTDNAKIEKLCGEKNLELEPIKIVEQGITKI